MTAQRVLITAGAAGIGRAIAEAFAANGADVWVVDRDRAALAACPSAFRVSTADVTDEAAMAEVFAAVREQWGALDGVVANAGIAGPTARVEHVDYDDWRACVAVNLDGAFLTAKHAIPLLHAGQGASITLISSTAGQHGYPNRAPYCAAKWAVIGLMKTLAMELGPSGIRANAICPGAVEGPRMEGVLAREALAKNTTRDAIYQGYASGTSLQSWVRASDIAAMAVFLASSGARLVSGQVIAVDGHTENPDPKV